MRTGHILAQKPGRRAESKLQACAQDLWPQPGQAAIAASRACTGTPSALTNSPAWTEERRTWCECGRFGLPARGLQELLKLRGMKHKQTECSHIGGAAFGALLGHVMRSVPFVTGRRSGRRPASKIAPWAPAAWVSSSIMPHSVRVGARWPTPNWLTSGIPPKPDGAPRERDYATG